MEKKTTRKTIYSIEDNMFRFWYRFVPENNSIIARARWNWLTGGLSRTCQIIWDIFFEDICSQYLWALLLKGKSPVDFSSWDVGGGTDPRTRSQTEIDIMAEQDRQAAFV